MSQTTLHIAEQDNVMVALRADRGRHRGRRRHRRQRRSRRPQDRDRPIPAGQTVLKYGYPIGVATRDIAPGEHVHSPQPRPARCATTSIRRSTAAHLRKLPAPAEQATFDGYRRADGRVGTRNEIWIVNTVGCVEPRRRADRRAARNELRQAAGRSTACTPSRTRSAARSSATICDCTQKVLAGLVRHPNAGGVLILGLGCENNQMKLLLESVGAIAPERVAVLRRPGRRATRSRRASRSSRELVGVAGAGEARADPRSRS